MAYKYQSPIQFVCPKCKVKVRTEIESPIPNWRDHGLRAKGRSQATCPNCASEFSGHVINSAGSCDVMLDEYPDLKVDAGRARVRPSEDDDWADYDVPHDPKEVFLESNHHANRLLQELGGGGAHLVNRMIFAHHITALETYLGDTLIRRATEDNKAMARLLSSDQDLLREKFTLAQIATDEGFFVLRC